MRPRCKRLPCHVTLRTTRRDDPRKVRPETASEDLQHLLWLATGGDLALCVAFLQREAREHVSDAIASLDRARAALKADPSLVNMAEVRMACDEADSYGQWND